MMFTLKLIIVCISLSVIGIDCAKNDKSKCDNKVRTKIDRSFASVVPTLNGVKAPETASQLKPYCDSVLRTANKAFSYVKSCLGSFGPTIAKMITTPFNKEFDSICRKTELTERKKSLLKAGECVNKASKGLSKCGNKLIDSFTAIQSASDNERILMGCCQANSFRKCFRKSSTKSGCDKESIDLIDKLGMDSIGTSIASFCGDYFENSDKCTKLMSKTPKLAKSYIRPKSFFSPIVSLFESFRNLKCDKKTEKRMDKLFAEMVVVGTDKPLPENGTQLRDYCTKITQNMGFIFGYVDQCISEFGQMIAKVIVFPMRKQYENVCRPGKLSNRTLEILKATQCGNKARSKLRLCMDKQIDAVSATARAPLKDRLPMTCCHGYAMRTCFRNAAENTDGCKEIIDSTEKVIMESISGAVDLACGDHFGSNDKCDKLIAETPKLNKTYVRSKSLFLPGIALLESFPDVNEE